MIDPKLLRADINTTAQQLKIKNYDLDIKAFLALEAQRKSLQSDAERLQQERNAYAKSMGQLIGQAKKKLPQSLEFEDRIYKLTEFTKPQQGNFFGIHVIKYLCEINGKV